MSNVPKCPPVQLVCTEANLLSRWIAEQFYMIVKSL